MISRALNEAFTLLAQAPNRDIVFRKTGPKEARVRELWVVGKDAWESDDWRIIQVYQIPLSLRIFRDPQTRQVEEIFLLSKKVLAQGGQTKVKPCFALLSGGRYVKKRCENVVQKILSEHLAAAGKIPGLISISTISAVANERGKKDQIFESMCEGDLVGAFKASLSLSLSDKKQLIEQLLEGLAHFHTLRLPSTLSCRDQGVLIPLGGLKVAHCDLKLQNILIGKGQDGQILGMITDFGSVDPSLFAQSPGIRSPEKIRLWNNANRTLTDCVQFYGKYGQAADMWAMGLIITSILVGRIDPDMLGYPPLKCIWERVYILIIEAQNRGERPNLLKLESFLADLQHSDVMDSIQELLEESLRGRSDKEQAQLKQLFDLALDMLQIKPTERISSAAALAKVRAIPS